MGWNEVHSQSLLNIEADGTPAHVYVYPCIIRAVVSPFGPYGLLRGLVRLPFFSIRAHTFSRRTIAPPDYNRYAAIPAVLVFPQFLFSERVRTEAKTQCEMLLMPC